MPFLDTTIALLAGIATAILALWWTVRSPVKSHKSMKLEDGGFSFLFVDGGLVDASDEAEAMLATSGEKSDWDGVTRLFKNRFNLPEGELMPPNRDGVEYFSARDAADNGVLEVRKSGNRIRIDLFDKDQSPARADKNSTS